MLTVTPRAAAQIRQSIEQSNAHDMSLRIAAKQKPDSSIEYGLGFDYPAEEDERVHCEGLEILIAAVHQPLLAGATLDFVELEAGQFAFIFLNPNDPHYVPPQAD